LRQGLEGGGVVILFFVVIIIIIIIIMNTDLRNNQGEWNIKIEAKLKF
jgi:hypothetical protein